MAKRGRGGSAREDFLSKIIGVLIVSYFIVSLLPNITSNYNTMSQDSTNFTALQLVMVGLFATITILSIVWLYVKYTGITK